SAARGVEVLRRHRRGREPRHELPRRVQHTGRERRHRRAREDARGKEPRSRAKMMAERNAGADGVGSVAQIADGERWTVAGPLTFADAGPVLEATRTLALPASVIVDCRGIGSVDSAAVALLLAWKRRATTEGRPLVFDGIPAALVLLADLYGVREILTA